jgi:hypothetical protein
VKSEKSVKKVARASVVEEKASERKFRGKKVLQERKKSFCGFALHTRRRLLAFASIRQGKSEFEYGKKVM